MASAGQHGRFDEGSRETNSGAPLEAGEKMTIQASKKLPFTIRDGGKAGERRTSADQQLERDVRAAFYAMCGKDGKSLNQNFRNVAKGRTSPVRMLMRRIREARRMRAPQSYEQAKNIVAAMDRWVEELHGRRQDTGEHRPAA